MNFYAIAGGHENAAVFALALDRPAQDDLTSVFQRIIETIITEDVVAHDPGYTAEPGEIVAIAPYALGRGLEVLATPDAATVLPALQAADIERFQIRAIAGAEWQGSRLQHVAFQRLDKRYLLTRERRRFMLAAGRLVRDTRPGIEVADRIDAVLSGDTLYVASWPRAHGILDLSTWSREATIAEAEAFIRNRRFAREDGLDVNKLADTWVRRKIASIAAGRTLSACTPQSLRAYARRFNVALAISKGRIVLPADKKAFKAVLSLLDQDLLAFEPTDDHWIVNSKRRVNR